MVSELSLPVLKVHALGPAVPLHLSCPADDGTWSTKKGTATQPRLLTRPFQVPPSISSQTPQETKRTTSYLQFCFVSLRSKLSRPRRKQARPLTPHCGCLLEDSSPRSLLAQEVTSPPGLVLLCVKTLILMPISQHCSAPVIQVTCFHL